MTGFGGAFARCAQSQHIHEWSCCVGERRARERLLPRSNLRVASAEAGDLLFRVEQKGNGEFVTGYVDEGAMTVSNPVYFVPQEQSVWFLPLPAPPPASGWEAEVAPDPPVSLVTSGGTLSADHAFSCGGPCLTVSPAQVKPNPPSKKPKPANRKEKKKQTQKQPKNPSCKRGGIKGCYSCPL